MTRFLWRNLLCIGVLASVFGFLSEIAAAQSKCNGPHCSNDRFVEQCSRGQRPTGCAAPNEQCHPQKFTFEDGQKFPVDPRRSCKLEARAPSCADFTWEKCCIATCRHDFEHYGAYFAQQFDDLDSCVYACDTAPEASAYVPKALEQVSKVSPRKANR